jgi:class 3 adenylate cyclase
VTVCPNCGHENEPGAKFCSQCATPLVEAPPAGGTERKILTVLFADLVGFTARAERLDPEDVQAVLAPYHARLRQELERWGGTVEKFIGDAVMALFGAPVAREDDPERAVRAALAIRDWIAEEGKLQVRIGVNTGEALVNLGARPESGEGMAAGDVVNTTARLQAAAPTNGILVGETTYRATAHTIDYRDHAAVEAKGKDAPVAVWEVEHARARFGVDLAPQARTPLVGRYRELDQLVGALARSQQQRSTELVTLVGVPGIGKSRLVGELFGSIDRGGVITYWRQGRSLPYGEGVSYWALAEMVKAQAGILETDSDLDVESKLARTVEALVAEDADWVLSHLRTLVGQGADVASASLEEAFAAWRRFFEALAEQRPLVLVFEDIQWADDGLLDFIEHLVDWVRDVPLLILCTARLELLERRPAWGGGKVNAAIIALAPLSNEETAQLISALSERPLLPADTQTALLERAGGNPLYAEQYVRMLAERETADDLPLPESVQGIIAARLDSLPREEKLLLQDAAVVGKVFWLGALGATEQQLHALQQKEFVQRARRSSVEGETEFAFKHLLVRDVAYGQIPRAERADKHVRAATWIQSLGRPEDHAEMVAHHYSSALELARAAGQDLGPIANRARAALHEAGDRAASLSAFPQAEAYYREALDLAAGDDPYLLLKLGRIRYRQANQGLEELTAARAMLVAAGDPESAAEAALALADLAWNAGNRDRVMSHLEDAQSLVAGRQPSRTQVFVLSEASRYDMLANRNESAIELGRKALKMAEVLGLDDLRAHALNNIGTARGTLGDPDWRDDLEQSIVFAERASSIPELIRAHNNVGVLHLLYGRAVEGHAGVFDSYELALRFGLQGFARWAEGGPVLAALLARGEWDRAATIIERYADREEEHYQTANIHATRAIISLARGGDLDEVRSDAERALVAVRPARDPQIVLTSGALATFALFLAGDETRAAEELNQALARLGELRQLGFAIVEAYVLAWVAHGLGRADELLAAVEGKTFDTKWLDVTRAVCAGDFRSAADILDEIGMPGRAVFFRLEAAKQFVAEGRRAEADEQLRLALAFYGSVGATRYVREGEALLAASA